MLINWFRSSRKILFIKEFPKENSVAIVISAYQFKYNK